MTDREFWLVVHRALLAVAGAIEKRYLKETAAPKR